MYTSSLNKDSRSTQDGTPDISKFKGDITMHPQFSISKSDLVDGQWYEGRCRNSTQARWSAAKGRFEYVRTKFDMKFVEEIFAPEDEKHYDVFYAKKPIPAEQVLNPIPAKAPAQMSLSSEATPTYTSVNSLRPDIFQEARE